MKSHFHSFGCSQCSFVCVRKTHEFKWWKKLGNNWNTKLIHNYLTMLDSGEFQGSKLDAIWRQDYQENFVLPLTDPPHQFSLSPNNCMHGNFEKYKIEIFSRRTRSSVSIERDHTAGGENMWGKSQRRKSVWAREPPFVRAPLRSNRWATRSVNESRWKSLRAEK